MPEPKGVAKLVGEVVPGVYRFAMHGKGKRGQATFHGG
jgi:hypothetical protein